MKWRYVSSKMFGIVEILEKSLKITIISVNSGHCHNTELMIMIFYWKEWNKNYIKKMIFLESGSHHAQERIFIIKISHAIKIG